jgi:hypothetical protein
MLDVLLVSLGSTGGLRVADRELLGSLRRAGVSAELASAATQRQVRTMMLTDLLWARAARVAASDQLDRTPARAIIYSSTTAALLWPAPGAIRFDVPSASNRPGRHGLWQRPLERRRLASASLLIALSQGGLEEVPAAARYADRELVLGVPIEPSGVSGQRDIAAITYAANPVKKGLDRVLEAWSRARRGDEELVVAGVSPEHLRRHGQRVPDGVRPTGMLPNDEYRALLRRSRVFVCAPRREDYGQSQLEALADGCQLVTASAPGPYVALPIARELDERLVSEDLAPALRIALDEPLHEYAERASLALRPYSREQIDERVATELIPRLLERR